MYLCVNKNKKDMTQKTITPLTYVHSEMSIDNITRNVVSVAKLGFDYGIMTACFINGEFVFCSEHTVDADEISKIEDIAKQYPNVITTQITDWAGYNN